MPSSSSTTRASSSTRSPPPPRARPRSSTSRSPALAVSLRNAGGAYTGAVSVATLFSGFAIVGDECTGVVLGGGDKCTVNIAVTAAGDATGSITSPLVITSAPGGSATTTLAAT